MVIRAIIFDCFGVLVKPGVAPLFALYPEKRNAIQDLLDKADIGELSNSEYLELSGKLVGLSPGEVDKLYQRTFRRNTKSISWVKNLKKSNRYKLALLSNIGHGRIQNYFSPVEFKDMFDCVMLSCDVGVKKPDPAIYEKIAKKLHLKLSECLMFDDNFENVEGAKRAGMNAIVFESVEQASAELSWLLELGDA
jgi:putative hydrolase of the HAD superfamily